MLKKIDIYVSYTEFAQHLQVHPFSDKGEDFILL